MNSLPSITGLWRLFHVSQTTTPATPALQFSMKFEVALGRPLSGELRCETCFASI